MREMASWGLLWAWRVCAEHHPYVLVYILSKSNPASQKASTLCSVTSTIRQREHRAEPLIPRDDLTGTLGQVPQQRNLPGGQGALPALDPADQRCSC